jgi:acyl transferase domain-containing protein
MAGLAAASIPLLRTVALHPPRLPLYSAYTGDLLAARTATDPGFWARHPVDPVLFWPTLDRLLRDRDVMLLDASPGQSLAASARRHPAVRAGQSDVVGLLPARPGPPDADRDAVRAALARVRAEGHEFRAERREPPPGVEPPFNPAANDERTSTPGGDR